MSRILLVEDEPIILRTTTTLLERNGHSVQPCLELTAARDFLDETDIDLLIVDVILPDGNGIDLLNEYRQRMPSLPALVMTGHLDAEQLRNVVGDGPTALLNKPAPLDELMRHIEQLLAAPHSDEAETEESQEDAPAVGEEGRREVQESADLSAQDEERLVEPAAAVVDRTPGDGYDPPSVADTEAPARQNLGESGAV